MNLAKIVIDIEIKVQKSRIMWHKHFVNQKIIIRKKDKEKPQLS